MFKNSILVSILVTLVSIPSFTLAAAIDPTMIISKKNVEEYLGFAVKEPLLKTKHNSDGIISTSCKYFPKNKLEDKGKIALEVYEPGDESARRTPKKYYAKMLKLRQDSDRPGNKVQLISDLGDSAYWYPRKRRLYLLIGDIYFTLEVSKDDSTISSDKGRADLQEKLAEHQFDLCMEVTKKYLLPNYKGQ